LVRIIEQDEYERELRKILNYGHTFGHALEGVTDHSVPHGLAVAWGVDVANYVAMRKGLLAPALFEELHRFIAAHYRLEVACPVEASSLLAMMRKDKKATADSVQLILPAGLGDLRLVPTAVDVQLERLLAEYLSTANVFTFAG
jgi:3-dehydroquinate synthase